jgi:uncharacterized protein (TIGR02118 family)
MIKVTFLYNHPADPAEFNRYFFAHHLPLTKDVPGCLRQEVATVVGTPDGSPPPYHFITEFTFASMETFQTALASEAAQRLFADVPNFTSAGMTTLICEIPD